jgi:hypothetical protein
MPDRGIHAASAAAQCRFIASEGGHRVAGSRSSRALDRRAPGRCPQRSPLFPPNFQRWQLPTMDMALAIRGLQREGDFDFRHHFNGYAIDNRRLVAPLPDGVGRAFYQRRRSAEQN